MCHSRELKWERRPRSKYGLQHYDTGSDADKSEEDWNWWFFFVMAEACSCCDAVHWLIFFCAILTSEYTVGVRWDVKKEPAWWDECKGQWDEFESNYGSPNYIVI